MKSFVIYVEGHKQSEKQAEKCRASCYQSGFDAELMKGVTPETLSEYAEYEDAQGGRITSFKRESKKVYESKKSCFTNHIRVWEKCIELNEPVAFLEQDSGNIRKWNHTQFDEVLILNAESAFKQSVFDHVRNKPWLNFGLNPYSDTPLIYNKENQWKGAAMMPGTAAYAITPNGAKRLLDNLQTYGWEQSDYFINSYNVNIQYIVPEYFTFKSPNLNMSHGY